MNTTTAWQRVRESNPSLRAENPPAYPIAELAVRSDSASRTTPADARINTSACCVPRVRLERTTSGASLRRTAICACEACRRARLRTRSPEPRRPRACDHFGCPVEPRERAISPTRPALTRASSRVSAGAPSPPRSPVAPTPKAIEEMHQQVRTAPSVGYRGVEPRLSCSQGRRHTPRLVPVGGRAGAPRRAARPFMPSTVEFSTSTPAGRGRGPRRGTGLEPAAFGFGDRRSTN